MEIDKTNRNNLKGYFQRGKIPTQQNFAEFVDATLNQAEDGLVKKPNEAISIEAQKESDNVLKAFKFYKDFANETPTLSLSLNAKNGNKLQDGFALSNQAETLLFIDEKTGNLGVGDVTPQAKLDVNGNTNIKGGLTVGAALNAGNSDMYFTKTDHQHTGAGNTTGHAAIENATNFGALMILGRQTDKGRIVKIWDYLQVNGNLDVTNGLNVAGPLGVTGSLNVNGALTLQGSLGNFTGNDKDEWPNVVWYRDTAKKWDEGLIKHKSGRGAFKRAGFGIHMNESREFGFWSSGWDSLFAVEGGTGNTKVKGTLTTGAAVFAGNSDLYFTNTNHNHTGFGNTTGYAAIENAKNFGSLMILGRSTNKGRIVKLWDFLQVNGNLEVTGYSLQHKAVFFSAYVSANNLSGNKDVLPLKAVSQNIGDGFNANSSKFKAPVKGVYSFTMNAYKADTGGLHWYLLKNGDYINKGGNTNSENSERCIVTMAGTGHWASRTIYVNLNANDQVWIKQAGTGRVDNFRSGLEGCLVHAFA